MHLSLRQRPASTALAALLVVLAALLAAGCGSEASGRGPATGAIEGIAERPLRVTATTNLVADLARQIGSDRVEVTALMGPGVDPHLYKASAGDVDRLRDADLILYGGLELEGRMSDLLGELGASGTRTVAVTRDVPEDRLLRLGASDGKVDPHVWFDPALWTRAAETVADALAEADPGSAEAYRARAAAYAAELEELDAYARERLGAVPRPRRVLVTSHDAFNYLGRAYDVDVEAIQGISTATEATTADVERIAGLLARRGVPAVFVESSVPPQTVEAVIDAARARGQRVRLGGELFSDSAGDPGTPEGTYAGMFRHNVDLIAGALR